MSPLCKFMDLKKKINTGEEKRRGKKDDEKKSSATCVFLEEASFLLKCHYLAHSQVLAFISLNLSSLNGLL